MSTRYRRNKNRIRVIWNMMRNITKMSILIKTLLPQTGSTCSSTNLRKSFLNLSSQLSSTTLSAVSTFLNWGMSSNHYLSWLLQRRKCQSWIQGSWSLDWRRESRRSFSKNMKNQLQWTGESTLFRCTSMKKTTRNSRNLFSEQPY